MSVMMALTAAVWADAGFKGASAGGLFPVLMLERVTLPATTWQVVGGASFPSFEGSGPQRLRVQFDCHAPTYAAADAAREALRVFLNGYQGVLGEGPYVHNVDLIQPLDFFDDEPRQFRCSIEFYVWFNFSS